MYVLFGLVPFLPSCIECQITVDCGGAQYQPTQAAALELGELGPRPLFEAMVIFGDSLSDTGALLNQSFGLAPDQNVYHAGRFSNGPVWVDYVADSLAVPSHSHAYGGATTTGSKVAVPKPFDKAIAEYLHCHDAQISGDQLYVLWIGHNDYYQGAVRSADIAAATIRALRHLVDAGGRYFLVPEVLPLTGTPSPFVIDGEEIEDTIVDNLVFEHNQALQDGLNLVQAERDVIIARSVPNRMRQRVLNEPERLGIENISDACYLGGVRWPDSDPEAICDDPDRYFFWDGVHPSTKVHCAYAIEMMRALGEAGLIEELGDETALLQDCKEREPIMNAQCLEAPSANLD